MCRLLQKIVSISLLSLFLLFIVPTHLLHHFVSHTDTRHICETKGLHISNAHHHCSLLQIDQDINKLPFNLFFVLTVPCMMYEMSKPILLNKNCFLHKIENNISDRAPPAV